MGEYGVGLRVKPEMAIRNPSRRDGPKIARRFSAAGLPLEFFRPS